MPTSPPSIKRVVSPTGSKIYFIAPKNDEIVSNPVSLEFGSEGVEIVPSGQNKPATGHHHIIIDAELPNMNLPIPADDNYVHFGDGSSSTQLTLEPGIHTLQLLLGDFLHIPHDPPLYSEKITVTVE
ncbi:MAG: rod shape-determining protein RodA [Gammaproteobacteria bacterium]|nr:rod shape-determining protein RodA [Gammaproteobacteria bacterium]